MTGLGKADDNEDPGLTNPAVNARSDGDIADAPLSLRFGETVAGAACHGIGTQKLGFRHLSSAKKLGRRQHLKRMFSSNRAVMSGSALMRPLSPISGTPGTSMDPSEKTPLNVDGTNITTEKDEEESPRSQAGLLLEMLIGKPINILLLFAPLAVVSHYWGWSATSIFWFNFLVMVPLASILGDFTEELAAHTSQAIGGLINATFGNAVEVVVAIQALLQNEIRVVQASMLGSIFSNLLLVLGGCFFFGGLKYKEQKFNGTAATAHMSLLALSSLALVLPVPFADYYEIHDEAVLQISRIAAVFLMAMYIQLLIFQLKTHADLFDDEGDEEPEFSFWVSLGGLVVVTGLITIFSDFLVGSIDGFVESSGVSRTFVGIIILPIVGNAVEHITAVSVAMKDKMDLAMGIAVGSSTQISLFVVPLTVLVGWACDRDMTLNFTHFEITIFVLSVLTVFICLSNPTGNWLEGSLLMTTYLMVAVAFWYEKVVDFR